VIEWAKACKALPEYLEASRANRRKFPGGYHAALHDAMTVPALVSGRYWRNGAQAFGADDVYQDSADTQAMMDFIFAGFSLAELSLQIGLASNRPSENPEGVVMVKALTDAGQNRLSKLPVTETGGKPIWRLDLKGQLTDLKTGQGWVLTPGQWVVLAISKAANNYGNAFSLDPVNDGVEKLSTFGDCLTYLEKKLG
jgi:hypothetical protein